MSVWLAQLRRLISRKTKTLAEAGAQLAVVSSLWRLPCLAILAFGAGISASCGLNPGDVTIGSTDDPALEQALKDAYAAQSLKEKAPVGSFAALILRAKGDADQASPRCCAALATTTARSSSISMATRSTTPPSLKPSPARRGQIGRGQGYRADRAALPSGPHHHRRRTAGRSATNWAWPRPTAVASKYWPPVCVLTAVKEDGYALATVDPPDATEDPQHYTIDVTFKAAEGRRAVIGSIDFTGLSALNEDFVRRRLLVRPGQLYPAEQDRRGAPRTSPLSASSPASR